jgi:hypothetical protein
MIMGTVTCASKLDDGGVFYEVVKKTLGDKANPKLKKWFKYEQNAKNWIAGYRYIRDYTGYENHLYGYITTKEGKKRYISILYGPKKFRYELAAYKITWHQSQWKNQREVVETFVHHFGLDKAYEIFFKWKIVRLDLWIDLGYLYDRVKRSIHKTGCSSIEKPRSYLRTLYLGSSTSPSRLIAYEKVLRRIDLGKKIENKKRKGVRLEVRLLNDAIPIETYAGYSKMIDIELWMKIENYFMDREIWVQLESIVDSRMKHNLKIFRKRLNRDDFTYAKLSMNGNGNFSRGIGKYLKKYATSYNFSQIWQEKVSTVVVGDFEVRAFFRRKGYVSDRASTSHSIGFFYDHTPSYLH